MAERVLSTRELNRALLARQLLLDRSRVSITRALETIGGLQTQYAPSGYIGLWSRLHDFPRESLTSALEGGRVIQATLMRATIHMVSARDYPVLSEGIRKGRRQWWLRAQRHPVDESDMKKVAGLVRKELSAGPLRQRDLVQRIEAAGFPRIAWSGAGLWVDLVRVPPSGTWERRRADLYALAADRIKAVKVTETEGRQRVVQRYLRGFGPATIKDIVSWSGLAETTLRPVLENVRLRRFRDEEDRVLVDVPRAPLPDKDTPAPVRFLPTWDATLLAHARRTQILPEDYRNLVFDTKTPHSVPTFTVDGAVAGIWRYEKGRVRLEPFGTLPRAARREVEDEAKGLERFHSD